MTSRMWWGIKLLLVFLCVGQVLQALAAEPRPELGDKPTKKVVAEITSENETNNTMKPNSVLPLDPWESPPKSHQKVPLKTKNKNPKQLWMFEPTEDMNRSVGVSGAIVTKIKKPELTSKMRDIRLEIAKKEGVKIPSKLDMLGLDPRGESEVRLCTANLNGYRFIIRRGKIPVKEKSLLAAVKKSKCHIVAIQGISARTYTLAAKTLNYLAKKLSKQTNKRFKGYSGIPGKRFKVVGFLLDQDRISVVNPTPHSGSVLSKSALFINPPYMLQVKVYGLGASESRTFDLGGGSKLFSEDNAYRRIEMAELLRKFAVTLRSTYDSVNPSVLVALGNRAGNRLSSSAQILSGRVRLRSLEKHGPCKINKDVTLDCERETKLPQIFFGTTSNGINEHRSIVKLDKWRYKTYYFVTPGPKTKERNNLENLGKESEIYLFDQDIAMAQQHKYTPGHYAGGFEALRNDLPNSPLVWTDLNW